MNVLKRTLVVALTVTMLLPGLIGCAKGDNDMNRNESETCTDSTKENFTSGREEAPLVPEDGFLVGAENVYVFEDGERHVTVELCSPRMVRVQYSMDGEDGYRSGDPEYYMVQKEVFGAVAHQIRDEGEKMIIRTGAMEVRIDKAPFKAAMYTLDGQLLSMDAIPAYEEGGVIGVKKLEGTENAGGIFGFGSGDHGRRNDLNRYDVDFKEFSMSHGRVISPFFMSTVGYGIFLNTISENTTFFKHGGGFETEGYLDYYFMYGPDFKTILDEYAELTGRMELYGKWALGFMLSKYGNDNATQAEFLEWIHRLRDEGYPSDCYVFDYGWRGDVNVKEANHSAGEKWGNQMWSNDKKKFPNVSAMFEEARELGFHVGLHNNAGTPEASGGAELFKPAYSEKWVKSYMDSVITTGYGDFFWPDEFDVLGSNTAPVLSAKDAYLAWKEYTDASRPMFMTRGSFAGQHFATAWSGDTDASESDLAYQIGFAIDTGLVGYWATSCDLGGFKTRPTDALYTRWTAEFGAWSAMMRTHGHDGREPWDYDETAQSTLKENLKIRYALYPYLYTSMWQGYSTGVPIMRAMLLEDESQYNPDAWDLNRQYYFGDWFLVAPATEARDTTVKVWFPPNTTWYHYYTGERYEGGENGKSVTLSVALDEIPVFVKAGAIVPMGPNVNYADELPLSPLTLDIYPKGTSSYTLYEDDGESRKYLTENAYATTDYTVTEKNGYITLTVGERYVGNPESYTPDDRSYIAVFHHVGDVKTVKLDGKALTVYSTREALDAAREGYYVKDHTLYVKFADTSKKTVLIADCDGMVLPGEGESVKEESAPLIKVEDGTQIELEEALRVPANASVGLPVDTEWKGYSGTGFVKGFKCRGDYVSFDVSAAKAGVYDLVLRVNCGKKNDATDRADRTGALYLDGKKLSDLAFAITETWGDAQKNGDWRDYIVKGVRLEAGKHTFKIVVEGENPGHYNLDSIRFAEVDGTHNGFSEIFVSNADAMRGASVEDRLVLVRKNGAYIGFGSVMAEGKKKFSIRLCAVSGGTLTVYETGVGDKILATLTLPADGQWQTLTVDCRDTDAHPSPIYLSFAAAEGGTMNVNVEWIRFEK